MRTHPSKAQHQARKATLLANVLAAHGATAAQAAALPDEGWATTAALAGVTLPSGETRAITVALLESKEAETKRPSYGANVAALVA